MIDFEDNDFAAIHFSISPSSLIINWSYLLYQKHILQKYCDFPLELNDLQITHLNNFHFRKRFSKSFLDKEIANAILTGLHLHKKDFGKAMGTAIAILKNKERFGNIQAAIDIVKAIEEENINVKVG